MAVDTDKLRADQKRGLVVGVVPTDGSQELRQEIDDFLADKDLANLYFLALEAFMSKDIYEDPFSYYEISGIHGMPYRAWDHVESVSGFSHTEKRHPAAGYCAHGSVVFPTWHRVYLAQFEQALYLHAETFAKGLGQEKTVLPKFRIPYFDPLLPRQKLVDEERYLYGIPVILMTKKINVLRPGKTEYESIPNPLYQFDFPEDPKGGFFWNKVNGGVYDSTDIKRLSDHTVRGYEKPTGFADHPFVRNTFDNQYGPTTDRSSSSADYLWQLFFGKDPWEVISNHFFVQNREDPDNNRNPNSLEGFHDNIHSLLGMGKSSGFRGDGACGQMSYAEVAGFDPVFWLHHANIDRLLAVWQGINEPLGDETAWWTSLEHDKPTYVEPAREFETPDTPLAPFRKAIDGNTTTWWTSKDVRYHTKLGYDYPETRAASQSPKPVEYLTKWANIEVGWVKSGAQSNTPWLDQLKKQISEAAPSLPKPFVVDESTTWDPQEQYVSSAAAELATAISSKVSALVQTAAPVLQRTLLAHEPSFEERFGSLGNLVQNGQMTRWNASFTVDKFALDGTFTIAFFLGDFNPAKAGSDWLHEPNLVGSSAIFASSQARIDDGNCENCAQKQAAGLKYWDVVGLTQALLTYWSSGESAHGLQVTSLEPEVVVPFLTANLHWRIISASGTSVPVESVSSLKVKVYSDTVALPQRVTEAPVFGAKVAHIEVTNGRPGGLSAGEQEA